jgi:hypothetical protein
MKLHKLALALECDVCMHRKFWFWIDRHTTLVNNILESFGPIPLCIDEILCIGIMTI